MHDYACPERKPLGSNAGMAPRMFGSIEKVPLKALMRPRSRKNEHQFGSLRRSETYFEKLYVTTLQVRGWIPFSMALAYV
jgi:hypothetical protein